MKVLWFSYELGYEELFEKFPMDNLDFYVPNFLSSGNMDWVEEKIIETKLKHGLDYIFIDHLDFLRDTNILAKGVSTNLSSYIGGIVQRIKSIAVKHEVIIFLMCHITKSKWTTNQLPTSEQIRDSGQITQLADIVMMMIRNRDKGQYVENFATLGIMENRKTGKTGKLALKLVGEQFVAVNEEEQTKLDNLKDDFDGF
jgi:replicative DNA helicase